MPPHSGEQELLAVDQVFHPFPLKILNVIQHESCVPRKTEQLSYWEILSVQVKFGERSKSSGRHSQTPGFKWGLTVPLTQG
jgi:hypothetical protein